MSWGYLGLLAATTSILLVSLGADCSSCFQWGLLLAFFGALITIAFGWDRIRGSERRQLVIDRLGFVHEGRRVPWESVISLLWVADAGGEGGMPEHVEIRVRSIPGFEAPRHRRVNVLHRNFGIAPNALIDIFEAAALPRRIPVLAIEPEGERGP